MELSASFERRRLGKHQQILSDISQRCREQEVSDLSSHLSAKVDLKRLERQGRELTFYTTTFMGNKNRGNNNFVESIETPRTHVDLVTINHGKPNIEKGYKHFPIRKIMKQNTKFDFIKPTNTAFPKLTHHIPQPTKEKSTLKPHMLDKQAVNGPVHSSHYNSPRVEFVPLSLPNVNGGQCNEINEKSLDRMDTCFSTKCVTLGPRQKTNLTQGSKSGVAISRPTKPKPTDFNREMSQLHLQNVDGEHSPPPNSEQEFNGAMTV